jgi:predicted phosphoribosyltransferase
MLSQLPSVQKLRESAPIVLGLPRGGVPIAFEIAKALHSDLDVMIVRKLGIPYSPEVAFGAISLGNVKVLNSSLIREIRLSDADMNTVIKRETAELERRNALYRGGKDFPSLEGKIVLVIFHQIC